MDLEKISKEEILNKLQELKKGEHSYSDAIMERERSNWVDPDGYVIADGNSKIGESFFVKGKVVYSPCFGGKPMMVGFVEEGVAYMPEFTLFFRHYI